MLYFIDMHVILSVCYAGQDGGYGDGVRLDGGGRGRQAHFRRAARPDEPQGIVLYFSPH